MGRYRVEQITDTRTRYHVLHKNDKGESLLIEITECEGTSPRLWFKMGYIDHLLKSYLSLVTYCTDSEGGCWGRYNPQIKPSADGKRNVINFDWMFENTEENKQRLIDECIRLFDNVKEVRT